MATIFEKIGKKKFGKKGLGKVGDIWNKKVKPVVNQVAKVAKFIPGPWQALAIAYDMGRVGSNVALGKQDPLALLRNLAQTYAFTDFEFGRGLNQNQYNKFSLKDIRENIGGRTRKGLESLFGGGEGAAEAGKSVKEIAAEQGYQEVPGVPNSFIKDGVVVTGDELLAETAKSGFSLRNFFSGLGDDEPGFGFGDILAGGGKIFDFLKQAKSGIQDVTGIDPALLLLAKQYADLTEKALEKQAGGMQDIRQELRPELQQAPIYGGGGFDLGAASLPAYAEGGEVLDMRDGGESVGPGTGTSDDIPAMLSDGEFVMTAKANMGAGAVKINKKKGGIMEIVPSLEPDRQRGADNMMKLMRYFEGVA